MKGTVGRNDEELLKSAWDWAGDVGKVHACAIRVCMVPTSRRGVWQLRAEAVEVVGGRAITVLNQHVQEWPNSSHSTLAGAIHAALMHLDARLTEPLAH